jgi:hypothetical protein
MPTTKAITIEKRFMFDPPEIRSVNSSIGVSLDREQCGWTVRPNALAVFT